MNNLKIGSKTKNEIKSSVEKQLQFFDSTLFIIIIVILILSILIFNVLRTIIKFYNLSIVFQKNSFALKYGLINIKNAIINPRKVQIIVVSQNYFQKKLNLFEIIKQFINDENNAVSNQNSIEIPGCNTNQKNQVLKLLLKQVPNFELVLSSNFRKIISLVLFFQIFPSIFLVLFFKFFNNFKEFYFLFFVVYLFITSLLILYDFKNNKLFVNSTIIALQKGIWEVETQFIEIHKIQSIAIVQNIWHKKSNIGHLYIHTAGGRIKFKFVNFTKAKKLVDNWLYTVESNPKSWNN